MDLEEEMKGMKGFFQFGCKKCGRRFFFGCGTGDLKCSFCDVVIKKVLKVFGFNRTFHFRCLDCRTTYKVTTKEVMKRGGNLIPCPKCNSWRVRPFDESTAPEYRI